ncbi:hypothetical protein L1987_60714 [Smallanthus sonchifolius]|uniref:Uncharacterized protein n=1 Tax=Smallanthus sonchifolius TaxID=185202 RepID=A0ACB9D9G2_9ASTR|nr:hypothetical protein L1987_60714 [Smallanthus sonchifolius]
MCIPVSIFEMETGSFDYEMETYSAAWLGRGLSCVCVQGSEVIAYSVICTHDNNLIFLYLIWNCQKHCLQRLQNRLDIAYDSSSLGHQEAFSALWKATFPEEELCDIYSEQNLTELDIQENGIDDLGGHWLCCFPESLTSLQVLNFANLNNKFSFDALEKLVSRCKSLRVLPEYKLRDGEYGLRE